jgi:hypothetical protein
MVGEQGRWAFMIKVATHGGQSVKIEPKIYAAYYVTGELMPGTIVNRVHQYPYG